MRKALAILVGVALVTTVASADLFMDFPATRDAAVNRNPGEDYASGGAMTQARVGKYRQHYIAMDFDWEAVDAFIAANPVPGAEPYAVLRMVGAYDPIWGSTMEGCRVGLVKIENEVDWIEGDGTCQFTNFTWSPDTQAITSQWAKTNLDGTGVGPWPWGDFDGKRNVAGQFNVAGLLFGPDETPSWVVLDDGFFAALRGQPNMHGFYTWDRFNESRNGEAYLREAGGRGPLLRVYAPEPATLLLIAVGGVGLVLRKRR